MMTIPINAQVARILLLTAVAGWFAAGPLWGQALPTAEGPAAYVAVGALGSIAQMNYGQRNVGGVALYADVNLTWRFGTEFQVQTLQFNQESGTRETTYLAGPRVSFRSHGLIPYAKVLVGSGEFNAPYHYGGGRYFVSAPGAGLDWSLTRRLRVRLINVEYQVWHEFTFGQMHPFVASTGVSLRIF